MDSPFAIEENWKPVVSRTAPPRRLNAAPKLTRERVLGSKKKFPSTAPSSTRVSFRRCANGSIAAASPNKVRMSWRSNWSTERMCAPLKLCMILLLAQHRQRIHAGGAPGGQPGGRQGDQREEDHAGQQGRRVLGLDAV